MFSLYGYFKELRQFQFLLNNYHTIIIVALKNYCTLDYDSSRGRFSSIHNQAALSKASDIYCVIIALFEGPYKSITRRRRLSILSSERGCSHGFTK